MGEKFNLNNITLSFPSLFTKKSFKGQKGKYQTSIIFEKGSASEKKLRKYYEAALEEAAGRKIKKAVCAPWKRLPGGMKGIVVDPADTPEEMEEGGKYADDRYQNSLILTAKNKNRPGVCDSRLNPLTADDDAFHGGEIANVRMHFYTYSANGGGIALQLDMVQKVKNGKPFGNYKPETYEDGFSIIEEDEDDEFA